MHKEFYERGLWKKSRKPLLGIYDITSEYPPEEKYNLTSQTRSSANSVVANIAEVHGRYHYADKVRVIVRGEIEETRSHLRVARSLKYVSTEQYKAKHLRVTT